VHFGYGPDNSLRDWTGGSLSTYFGTRPQFDLFPIRTTDWNCAPEEGNYLQTGRINHTELFNIIARLQENKDHLPNITIGQPVSTFPYQTPGTSLYFTLRA
jgi:hypothetical protein